MPVPADVTEFLAAYNADVRALALKARGLVLKVFPQALEQVDVSSRLIGYGYDRTYKGLVCAVAPQKTYVNLMFSRGAALPDPDGLLEGTGKQARHVKLQTSADVSRPAVRALLQAALDAHGA